MTAQGTLVAYARFRSAVDRLIEVLQAPTSEVSPSPTGGQPMVGRERANLRSRLNDVMQGHSGKGLAHTNNIRDRGALVLVEHAYGLVDPTF